MNRAGSGVNISQGIAVVDKRAGRATNEPSKIPGIFTAGY
jgi:hypothetical protein